MFWVLIFLLTYLISIGSRKKVLYSWLIFAVTTFVLYSAIMYGMHKLIFSTQAFLPYIATIKYIIWGLAIILWLIEIKDFFWYGQWISLAIPKWAKPTLEYVTKKWTYMSAFVLAVLSTFVELPCTIWIPLAYVWAVGTKINIFAALGIYNFFFILPLIIIILGIYYWIAAFKTEDGDLAINKVSNKKIMRLVAGIILITLWVLFLTKVI
jgi:cytochrome c biogenesis protein CcdA